MFQISWSSKYPNFHPYEQYVNFAGYCQREESTGLCDQDPTLGGVFRQYVGDDPSSTRYQERYWLLFVDSILLQCCDGTFAPDRQSCPDCAAKNYAPIIIGVVVGF